ncbi:DUF1549 domain-containing protein [Lignipirellula cremea]|uniref:DUF1549 domain-containing protein n=1 Tax=Lignipirellula cremea TaxID=2528010 RepID=A0A518DKU1_9BACT|nr:DUF1549 domain-containing protein [Lignipirellula cremea]QDU92445.1 hypothetical protein Pla8534_01930 [Lignipirellula cremea]
MWCKSTLSAVLLLASTAPVLAADPVSQIIDDEINAALLAEKIAPAPPATDSELLRRLYLDILGRIPTPDEAQRFSSDSRADKHHRLIDELLASEEMPAYWRSVMDEWFNGGLLERDFGNDGFLTYLEQALRTNKPWNQIAREMLDPDLTDEQQHGAAYFLAVRLRSGDNAAKIDSMTSGVASVFFGVQLQCAKCHDHPFVDQWKQDHYYGLAAFLGRTQEAKVGNTPAIKERAEGEVTFLNTSQEEKTAQLMFLDSRVFDEPPPPEDRNQWYAKGKNGLPDAPYFSRRQVLADYALTAESPFFKRAIINRLWKQLMGRGLVEPVDQMHAENPASHPALLQRLADDFAQQGFNLRRLMAGILHSDAYLRSTQWTGAGDRPRDASYAVGLLKPLTPDQLAVSIGVATGHYDLFRAKLEREQEKRKIAQLTPAVERAIYASDREVREFASRFRTSGDRFEANASQALFLSYNSRMQKQLQPSAGNLVDQLSKQTSNADAIQQAFLATLSRPPSSEETNHVEQFLSSSSAPRPQLWGELVWSLLCSAEFRFNH